jgi:hypothetical protein
VSARMLHRHGQSSNHVAVCHAFELPNPPLDVPSPVQDSPAAGQPEEVGSATAAPPAFDRAYWHTEELGDLSCCHDLLRRCRRFVAHALVLCPLQNWRWALQTIVWVTHAPRRTYVRSREYGSAIMRGVADQLAELRAQQGVSLDVLSQRTGLHPTSIGLAMRGKRGMTIASAAVLGEALGRPLSELVRRAELEVRPT